MDGLAEARRDNELTPRRVYNSICLPKVDRYEWDNMTLEFAGWGVTTEEVLDINGHPIMPGNPATTLQKAKYPYDKGRKCDQYGTWIALYYEEGIPKYVSFKDRKEKYYCVTYGEGWDEDLVTLPPLFGSVRDTPVHCM